VTAQPPAQIASAAAESIRSLNHALYAGLDYPGDAYSLVGNLARLVSMLPQALTMTRGAVQKLADADQLRSDRGTLPDDLADTYGGLDEAASMAQELYQALNATHGALSHLGLKDGA